MDNLLALSEEDIKLRYITPSILQKGWSVEDITMETKVKLTDGKINLSLNNSYHLRLVPLFYKNRTAG